MAFLDALKPYLAADAQVDILSVELRNADILAGEDGLELLKQLESASGVKLWGQAVGPSCGARMDGPKASKEHGCWTIR